MKKKFEHPSIETNVYLPTHKGVCPNCGGHGTHDRNDLEMSEIVNSWIDDGEYERVEEYMEGKDNSFTVICEECNGNNVIDVVDFEYFEANYPKDYRNYCAWMDAERESAYYSAMERRMGA